MTANHYSEQLNPAELLHRVHSAFPKGARPHQLAGIDQLHIGGIQASQELLTHLPEYPQHCFQILEIGAGLGGLQRLYTSQLTERSALNSLAPPSVDYMTLDITPEFSLLNLALNTLCNTRQTSVITGDGQQLPVSDNQFDAVILQHSLLNMPDQQRCLRECHRALKPGGKLILHEVLRGDLRQPIIYPVPWADDEANSHLLRLETLFIQLNNADLTVASQQNGSAEALEWRQQQSHKEAQRHESRSISSQSTTHKPSIKSSPINKFSPREIFGVRFMQMATNLLANLQTGAIEVHEIVAEKQS